MTSKFCWGARYFLVLAKSELARVREGGSKEGKEGAAPDCSSVPGGGGGSFWSDAKLDGRTDQTCLGFLRRQRRSGSEDGATVTVNCEVRVTHGN